MFLLALEWFPSVDPALCKFAAEQPLPLETPDFEFVHGDGDYPCFSLKIADSKGDRTFGVDEGEFSDEFGERFNAGKLAFNNSNNELVDLNIVFFEGRSDEYFGNF